MIVDPNNPDNKCHPLPEIVCTQEQKDGHTCQEQKAVACPEKTMANIGHVDTLSYKDERDPDNKDFPKQQTAKGDFDSAKCKKTKKR